LLRLGRLLGTASYRTVAERLLAAYAPGLAAHGLHASTLFMALEDLLHEPAHVAIVGARGDPRTQALHAAALSAWRPGKLISHHEDGQEDIPVPEVVRAMQNRATAPTAFVCAGTACAPPVTDPRELAATIASFQAA